LLLSIFGELVERIEVFLVELDCLQVGLDSRRGDRLGENDDTTGNTVRDEGGSG